MKPADMLRALARKLYDLPPTVSYEVDLSGADGEACEKARALLDECEKTLIEIDALDPSIPDACTADALRGLVMLMGEKARATLAKLRGEP